MNLQYIDSEAMLQNQDKKIHKVSGYMAGIAFNSLCKMIGGRWPNSKIEDQAPEAYEFFMKFFIDE